MMGAKLNVVSNFYKTICYALIFYTVTVCGAKKQWLHNTNYDNPFNWDAGRLPCPLDKIHFPNPSPAVYLKTKMSVAEMVLPTNGEFMLSNGFTLSAAPNEKPSPSQGQRSGSCNESLDIHFNRTNPEDWFNPMNWCETSEDGICIDPQPLRLDTELVPCQTDDVVFPPYNSFLVQIASTSGVKVKTLQVGSRTLTTQQQIQKFFASNGGKRQFKIVNNTNFEVSNSECGEKTGCSCGNDVGEIYRKICDFKTNSCIPNSCVGPLLPKGNCCPLCGAFLLADYGFGFDFAKLQNALNTFKSNETQFITSKLKSDRIQIVVVDGSDGENAKRKAKEMHSYIKKDIRGPNSLWLTNVQLQTSGKGHFVPEPKPKKKGPNHISSIVGIAVTVIIVLLLIAFTMYCLVDRSQCRRIRDKLPSAITFRRFKSEDENAESVELDESVSYIDIMNRMEEQTSFDNPIYGTAEKTPPKDESAAQNNNMVNNNDQPAILDASSVTFNATKPRMQRGNSFSNPLFGDKSSDFRYYDATVKVNPVYNSDDIDDSSI